jgi:hypothetical protein
MDSVGIPKNFTEAAQTAINEALKNSNLVTKVDLKEFKDEMKYLEYRLTNKVGAIVIGTATVMMFVDKYLLFLEK